MIVDNNNTIWVLTANIFISQKWINYDTPKEDPSKTGDSFYITKNINGWSDRFSVDEQGGISIIGWKDPGQKGVLGLTLVVRRT